MQASITSKRIRKPTGAQIWRNALDAAKRCTKPGDTHTSFNNYFIGALSAELGLGRDLLSEFQITKDAVFGSLPKVGAA